MASIPTGPPVLAHQPRPPRGIAAALRLVMLWGPFATFASLWVAGLLTDPGSSNALKTVVFFGTAAGCLALLASAAKLEARRIQATSPAADLTLLSLVEIGIGIVAVSVLATAFTGFEIVYDLS